MILLILIMLLRLFLSRKKFMFSWINSTVNVVLNVGRGQHKLASKASALVAETRKLLLNLNHCPNKVVTFTSSATEALNIILRGLFAKIT